MSHPTRKRLLDSGLNLAETIGLSNLSVNAIVGDAGLAKGTFYRHFENRTIFLIELHQRFHEHIKDTVLPMIIDLKPGAKRLRIGATSYLEHCREMSGVKALLLEARVYPEIAQEVNRRNQEFTELLTVDFEAMKVSHPEQSAYLFVVMTAEIAMQEAQAEKTLPILREALFDYLP